MRAGSPTGETEQRILTFPETERFQERLPVFEYETGFTLEVVPFDVKRGELVR